MTTWDGDDYQRRFDDLAAAGVDVHGEATFVRAFAPSSVLDAGCGTGRVAIELARHGIDVVGADLDASMLATARAAAPELTWVASDLAALELGRTFDVVVMAGNVPLFTPPGTHAALVAGCARHVAPGGHPDDLCVLRGMDVIRHAARAGQPAALRVEDFDMVDRIAPVRDHGQDPCGSRRAGDRGEGGGRVGRHGRFGLIDREIDRAGGQLHLFGEHGGQAGHAIPGVGDRIVAQLQERGRADAGHDESRYRGDRDNPLEARAEQACAFLPELGGTRSGCAARVANIFRFRKLRCGLPYGTLTRLRKMRANARQADRDLRQPIRPAVEPSSPAVGRDASCTIGARRLHNSLPSSTPHWSKGLMSQITDCTKTLCS